jgi:hypothetical protein
MKTSNFTSRMKEEIQVVEQRGGQLRHDLTEFVTNLDGIETLAVQLNQRALEYKPQPERHGCYTVDQNVDRTDPNEALAFAKERLRRTAENLTRVSDLVEDARRKIDAIVG